MTETYEYDSALKATVWRKNGKYHRKDNEPAIIYDDGRKAWYKHGEIYKETYKTEVNHYFHGEYHNYDGPATRLSRMDFWKNEIVEDEYYYIHGVNMNDGQHKNFMKNFKQHKIYRKYEKYEKIKQQYKAMLLTFKTLENSHTDTDDYADGYYIPKELVYGILHNEN